MAKVINPDPVAGAAASLRRVIVFAMVLASFPLAGHAQDGTTRPPDPTNPRDPTQPRISYTYTAETVRPIVKSRVVTAGALKWECEDNTCTNSGPWTALGIEACRSLARVVGEIGKFGRPGAEYTAAQVTDCNRLPPQISHTGVVAVIQRSCTSDADCDDGVFCTGTERCGTNRKCQRPIPVDCDDSIACTIDRCAEATASCTHAGPDQDGDGHIDESCLLETGSAAGDDCDDIDPTRYPGSPEICNAVDEDCNPATIGEKDSDNDGFIDASCSNGDLEGEDCDDARRGVNPNVPEVCNGRDDDCSGVADDNDAPKVTTWLDNDRDGFGAAGGLAEDICLMGNLTGRSLNNYDCDDRNARKHPGYNCP